MVPLTILSYITEQLKYKKIKSYNVIYHPKFVSSNIKSMQLNTIEHTF